MAEFITFVIVCTIIIDGIRYTKTGKSIFDNLNN